MHDAHHTHQVNHACNGITRSGKRKSTMTPRREHGLTSPAHHVKPASCHPRITSHHVPSSVASCFVAPGLSPGCTHCHQSVGYGGFRCHWLPPRNSLNTNTTESIESYPYEYPSPTQYHINHTCTPHTINAYAPSLIAMIFHRERLNIFLLNPPSSWIDGIHHAHMVIMLRRDTPFERMICATSSCRV